MSKQSRQFKVPDSLASLYDFANSLDVRSFTHHGVTHQQHDELVTPQDLAAWMAERGLTNGTARVTPIMLKTARQLRASIRTLLQCDPGERHTDPLVRQELDRVSRHFPLFVATGTDGSLALVPARKDALAGLSTVVAAIHDAALTGTLDRLKMCASEDCRRVFYDRSKPASRRWCLSTLCGNRMKTRSYRARHPKR